MIAGGYTIQYVEDYHIPLWQFLPVQTIQNGIYTSSIKTATYKSIHQKFTEKRGIMEVMGMELTQNIHREARKL